MSTSAPLLGDIRARLAREGTGVGRDVASAMTAARRDAGILADDAVLARWDSALTAELCGAGPLEDLLALDGVTDVLVNAPDEVWIDRGSGLERADVGFASDAEVRALAYRLAAAAGRRLDDAAPFVDAQLPDGTRLHAILPPLALHTTLSLRVLARRRMELGDLISAGTLTIEVAELVRALVRARLALLISGGTGSGKTTVLGALLGVVPADQRIVLIEDAAEVTTRHPHVVRLLARTANVEGAGGVGLRELVRQALRMRPDRVVVGEFRGGEVVELLAALNTGHAGGAATVHANGIAELPARLEALGALGGLDRGALTAQAVSALEVVLHLHRNANGRRTVSQIGCFSSGTAGLEVQPVWTAAAGLGIGAAALCRRLLEHGCAELPALLAGVL